VNVTNEYGQTALYIASLQGHATILQLLLSYGADQSIAAFGGSTPWSVAEANKHHTVTNLLSLPDSHPTMVLSMKDSLDQFSFPFPNEGKTLIGNDIHHPGAGSYTIDDALPTASIQKIKTMWSTLPKDSTAKKKEKCSTRYYFCDGEKYICRALAQSIQHALPDQYAMVFPRMRFLHYTDEGSVLAPHVDLSHTENGLRSTHTFILYLTTCENGGETTLLQSIQSEFDILAQVSPVMGRLLLFPHTCPHMGSQVHDEKLILRGEVILSLTAI